MEHLKKLRKENPKLSFKEILKLGKKSYKKSKKQHKKSMKHEKKSKKQHKKSIKHHKKSIKHHKKSKKGGAKVDFEYTVAGTNEPPREQYLWYPRTNEQQDEQSVKDLLNRSHEQLYGIRPH